MAQLFNKATSRTLRAKVVDMIRDAIVNGKLKPGEHLKETVLAEQMSVSRSPVREALRQLEQEGLIVSIPNQGSFVKVFDEKDVEEIFTLRAALEDLACEIVLKDGRLQPADFQRLEAYIEQQREAIDAWDFDRLTKLDVDFHEFICGKSESERLLKMWQSLHAQIQVLFYHRFQTFYEVLQTVDTDHSAILEALRHGDAEQFSKINKEVNARVAEECIKVIRLINAEQDSWTFYTLPAVSSKDLTMSIQYSIVNAVFGGWQQFEDCLGICRFPGIPVWLLGEDSKFPGIPYVIFPGNVSTPDSLAQVITILRNKH